MHSVSPAPFPFLCEKPSNCLVPKWAEAFIKALLSPHAGLWRSCFQSFHITADTEGHKPRCPTRRYPRHSKRVLCSLIKYSVLGRRQAVCVLVLRLVLFMANSVRHSFHSIICSPQPVNHEAPLEAACRRCHICHYKRCAV